MGILWNLYEKKEKLNMLEMNINSGGKMIINDNGKVEVTKEVADEIIKNSIEDDNGKKPEFEIKD